MGLSISCKIFECFSTVIQWIAQTYLSIAYMLHILDDFFIAEKTEQDCCRYLDNITVKNGKKVTLRELQSIIGALDHCYIIPAGRAFLRRLIDLTIGVTDPHTPQ